VFLYTDPPSAVGFWFALEDCTRTNGCLSFVPGSHLTHGIGRRFVRLQDGGTGFIDIAEGMGEQPEPGEEEFKVEECSAGIVPPFYTLCAFVVVSCLCLGRLAVPYLLPWVCEGYFLWGY